MNGRNIILTAAIVIVIALGAWGIARVYRTSEVKPSAQTAPETSQTNSAESPSTNEPITMNTGQCQRNFDSKKLQDQISLKNQLVTLEVKNFGTIQVELYDQDAPKTVENFLRLTHAGFYDCLTFHRIAKGFVIQGGDPDGDGRGGLTASGQLLPDELNMSSPSYQTGYVKGVLAMANTGQPNSGSSQFFIMLDDNPQLPKNYTIFGKVIVGQDIVDKIGQVDIVPQLGPTDGQPKVPVIITKATISSK